MRSKGELITTAEVAQLLGITIAWTNKQAAKGRLPVAHKLPGLTGAYLFQRDEIEALASQRQSAA